MENKNVTYLSTSLSTSDLLINSGLLITLFRFVHIINVSWQAICQYWLVLALIFVAELVVVVVLGVVKWLINKVAK